MKKIASAAAILAAAMLITVSASAADISMKRLGKTAQYASSDEVSTAQLLTSRTVKNTLVIKSNEAFIVPAGKKLVLTGGCRIQGTLYIQQGGTLSVTGGALTVSGEVVNDGLVSIGSKASLNVKKGGELYTSSDGTFRSSTANITLSSKASVACLGKSSVKGCSSAIKNQLLPKAVSAVNTVTGTGNKVLSTENISADIALSMIDVDYYQYDSVPDGSNVITTNVLFDNGSSIDFTFIEGKLSAIGGAEMHSIMTTADLKDSITDYSNKLAAAWQKKWKSVSAEKDGTALPQLTLFTYKMSDGSWFAAMIYPTYKSNEAVLYRLSGGKVTELGSVTCGLQLSMLKNGSEYILHSTLKRSFISGANGATGLNVMDDYYKIGKKSAELLGSFEKNESGNNTSEWSALSNGEYSEITSAKYNSLQRSITKGYTADYSQNFDVTGDLWSDYFFEFTDDEDGLVSYIAARLYSPEKQEVTKSGGLDSALLL